MTLQHPLQPKLVSNSVISVLSGSNSDENTHEIQKVKDRYNPSLSHNKIKQVHLNCWGSLSYPSQRGTVMLYSLNSVTEHPLILPQTLPSGPYQRRYCYLDSSYPQSSLNKRKVRRVIIIPRSTMYESILDLYRNN